MIHLLTSWSFADATVACGARATEATPDLTRVTCLACLGGRAPCTCSPLVSLCPACRAYNQAHRGHPTTRPALKTEKAFQSWLREAALAAGWRYYHPFTSLKSTEGYPDTTLLRLEPSGTGARLVFAELKMPGKQPTTAQRQWLEALGQVQHVAAHLWYPTDLDTILEVLR